MSKMIAPPSQGKVERAREMFIHHLETKPGLHIGAILSSYEGGAAIAAITQALCESEAITACSNQRFDTVTESSGAEAMREAAANLVDERCLFLIGREALVEEIRSLPLPPSPVKLDHRSDCQLYTVPTYGLCTCDFDQRKAAQIKSKQPDTGVGK